MRLGILSVGLLVGLMASLIDAPVAHAGGVELPSAGTRALGRGGAAQARADDPMTLLWNPAGLARTPGIQLSLQTHLILYDACFQRFGTYGEYAGDMPSRDMIDASGEEFRWDRAANGGRTRSLMDPEIGSRYDSSPVSDLPLPEVCNSGRPQVVPNLVLTARLTPEWGFAFGLVAPAAVGNTRWGRTEGGVQGIVNGLPAPSRYALIEEDLLIAFPTIGVAYRPHPAVSIGAAFGWGVAPSIQFTTITRAVRGEDFANDVLTELDAADWFVPRVTASVHVVPHDNIDIVASFMWQDDIRAEGDLTLTTGYYRPADDDYPLDQATVPGVTVDAPLPWQAGLSFRYADRITPRHDNPDAQSRLTNRVEDSMQNERWDIELDLVYEMNSRVDQFTVLLPPCPSTAACDPRGRWEVQADNGLFQGIPPDISLQKQWRDQLSLRVGGDWNFIPGVGSARLGFSYETKGIKDGFEQLDILPLQRFGLHLGLTFRIAKWFDISVAYARIFQSTTTVSEDRASLHQTTAETRIGEIETCGEDPAPGTCSRMDRQGTFGEGTVINAGTYKSHFDILSLGLTYHFR